MNKIIIIIIILILIVLYFTYRYDKKNIERFNEADINVNNVVAFLASNYLKITQDGGIAIQSKNNSILPIKVEKGLVKLGDKFSFDPSNNKTQCGDFSIKNDGNFIGVKNNFEIDPSGNLEFGDFKFENGNIKKTDGSINVDSSGNLEFGNFLYDTMGRLERKDGSLKVDSLGNLEIGDFKFEKGNIKKTDGKLNIDPSGNLEFGNFLYDTMGNLKSKDDKIKVDSLGNLEFGDFKFEKGNIKKTDGKLNIDPSGNLEFGNFLYDTIGNLKSKDDNIKVNSLGNLEFGDFKFEKGNLERKDGSIKVYSKGYSEFGNFVYDKSGRLQRKDGNLVDNELCTTVNNLPYFKVSKIILRKDHIDISQNIYHNLSLYPLHIAGIQFIDVNNKAIEPYDSLTQRGYYTLSTINMEQGVGSVINTKNLFDVSGNNFVGKGILNQKTHVYEFIFSTPQLIKNIIITNRKDGWQDAINYSTLLIYGNKVNNNEILLKTISLNDFDQNPHYSKGNFFIKDVTTSILNDIKTCTTTRTTTPPTTTPPTTTPPTTYQTTTYQTNCTTTPKTTYKPPMKRLNVNLYP